MDETNVIENRLNELEKTLNGIFNKNRDLKEKLKLDECYIESEAKKRLKKIEDFQKYLRILEILKQDMENQSKNSGEYAFFNEIEMSIKQLRDELEEKENEIERKKDEFLEKIDNFKTSIPKNKINTLNDEEAIQKYAVIKNVSDVYNNINDNMYEGKDIDNVLIDSDGYKYHFIYRLRGTPKFKTWNKQCSVGLKLLSVPENVNKNTGNLPIKRNVRVALKNLVGGPDWVQCTTDTLHRVGHNIWFYEYMGIFNMLGPNNEFKSLYLDNDNELKFEINIDVCPF